MSDFNFEFKVETDLSAHSKRGIALVTGITGQDGFYISKLLLEKGYEVHGLVRRSSQNNMKNLEAFKDKITIHYGDLSNEHPISHLIYELQPDEIYNLAAQSDVRISFDIPEYTCDIDFLGVVRLLEAVKRFSKYSRVYIASSSEMFGSSPPPQNEDTPMIPQSPYGVAKHASYNYARMYRNSYDMFICNGILFNHESPIRGENFVTRKIIKGLCDIKFGKRKELYLGNLSAKRDWGFSGDYMEAAWMMMQSSIPNDYVVGTGESHSVQEFLKTANEYIKIDIEDCIKIDSNLYRPSEVNYLLADSTKIRREIGWKPKVDFNSLVKMMVEEEMKRRIL